MARRDDPELLAGPPRDLHALRARDPQLDALCLGVQRRAAVTAARGLRGSGDEFSLRALLGGRKVLVTGSEGYLGTALCWALEELQVPVARLDAVGPHPADVGDDQAVRARAEGCGAVLHCAALHAPHAATRHEDDFVRTNVGGAASVLRLGLPVVHTSTTSLTITASVRARERAGELAWLDERSQRPDLGNEDPPRNKYGRTKLEAEQLCLAAARAGQAVVILRAPRFFPEDALEDGALPGPNLKACELLGRRCALVDLVDAHLRALGRIRAVSGRVLTLCAPWPLPRETSAEQAAAALRARFPQAEPLFARQGWRLPQAVSRVYDAHAAVECLGWRPAVTFEAVLHALERTETDAEADGAPASALSVGELLRGAY